MALTLTANPSAPIAPTSTPTTSTPSTSTANPIIAPLASGVSNFLSGNESGVQTPSVPTTPNIPATVPANTPTVMSANTINNTTPLAVPPVTTPIANNALAAHVDSTFTQPPNTTANANGTVTQNPPVVDPRSALNDQISTLIGEQGTKGSVTNNLNSQFGVDAKQQAYTDAYNQYNQKKLAYQQQIDQVYNDPSMTREQSAQKVSEVSRQNNADLANLAVITQAAQGNLQGAMDIVKRKLDAQFEPIQTQIDNLGKFIQLNNADLTDSQKTKLENQRFVMQNNLTNLMSAKSSAHQFALQQGIQDPQILSAIDNAQTPADVYTAVGGNASGLPSTSSQGALANVSQTNQQYIDHTADGTAYVSQDRLNNMTPYQKQQASAEFASAGIRVLQPGEVSAIGTIDQAGQDLSLFENAANKLLTPGFLGRIAGLTTNQLAQFTQSNPDWRQFQTLRAGLIKSVQGIAAGAPGLRVTGAELANAADALPNSTDNLESSKQAVQTFRDLLSVNKNILLRNNATVGNTSSGNQSTVKTKAGTINVNW